MTAALCRVSVIMSVYNGEQYLKEAIDSILKQTFLDFEFIIINDGSTDKTEEIVTSYKDSRIKLINQSNHGLVYSINRGIVESKSGFIARMDADDIALPSRLAKQVKFLDSHPEVGLVGSWMRVIDPQGNTLQQMVLPTENSDLKRRLFITNTFGHGTVMMRREAYDRVGGYRVSYYPADDYDLWRRIALIYEVANLGEVLYLYRDNPIGIMATKPNEEKERRQKIVNEMWEESTFPPYGIRKVVAQGRFYQKQPGLLNEIAYNRYINDQYLFASELLKRKKLILSLKTVIGVILLAPIHAQNLLISGLKNYIKIIFRPSKSLITRK